MRITRDIRGSERWGHLGLLWWTILLAGCHPALVNLDQAPPATNPVMQQWVRDVTARVNTHSVRLDAIEKRLQKCSGPSLDKERLHE